MASEKQQAANARNALRSTGPRTPKGRARSSMNALRHGLSARDFVVFERERQEFETFLAAWSLDIRPAGALEEELFAQITQAAWNMRRVRRAESNLTGEKNKWFKDAEDDPLTKSHKISYLNHYGRYHARNERSFYRALREFHRIQTTRVPGEGLTNESAAPPPTPETAVPDRTPAPPAAEPFHPEPEPAIVTENHLAQPEQIDSLCPALTHSEIDETNPISLECRPATPLARRPTERTDTLGGRAGRPVEGGIARPLPSLRTDSRRAG